MFTMKWTPVVDKYPLPCYTRHWIDRPYRYLKCFLFAVAILPVPYHDGFQDVGKQGRPVFSKFEFPSDHGEHLMVSITEYAAEPRSDGVNKESHPVSQPTHL